MSCHTTRTRVRCLFSSGHNSSFSSLPYSSYLPPLPLLLLCEFSPTYFHPLLLCAFSFSYSSSSPFLLLLLIFLQLFLLYNCSLSVSSSSSSASSLLIFLHLLVPFSSLVSSPLCSPSFYSSSSPSSSLHPFLTSSSSIHLLSFLFPYLPPFIHPHVSPLQWRAEGGADGATALGIQLGKHPRGQFS